MTLVFTLEFKMLTLVVIFYLNNSGNFFYIYCHLFLIQVVS